MKKLLIALIVVIVIIVVIMVLRRPASGTSTGGATNDIEIVYWSFLQEDGDIRVVRELFAGLNLPGVKLTVRRYGFEELHEKLLAIFAGGGQGAPDISDIEISQIGRFYKQDPIGFLDQTALITNSPYYSDQILSRLTPYTYKGRIYGIDGNLSLSMFFYRCDLFEKYNISTNINTWDDFIQAGLELKKHGIFMLQVPNGANPEEYNEDFVPQLLIQQGGGYFDKDGNVIVNNEIGVRTITLIRDFVLKHKIAMATGTDIFSPPYYAPYLQDEVATMIMPSWMLYFFMKENMPSMAGKWRIMPLPMWKEGGIRTSTAGGGALVITRFCKHPDIAWKIVEAVRMTHAGGLLSNRIVGNFPPIKSVIEDPALDYPDPYLGGQSVGRYFLEYASQIPAYYISPFWWNAHLGMASEVLYPVLVKNEDPKKALNAMAERLNKLIKRQ